MNKLFRSLPLREFCSGILFAWLFLPSVAHASGVRAPLETGQYVGIGGAAIADDATTNYTNAAGLTRIDTEQVVLVGTGVLATTRFEGDISMGRSAETGKATANVLAAIPAFHYAMPLTDRIAIGTSVTMPFGGGTDYPEDSIARTTVLKGQMFTPTLTQSVAYRFTDHLSIGAGLDLQLFWSTINNVIEINNRQAAFNNSGTGWDMGWHVGGLYEFTPRTRFGVSYHSGTDQTAYGTSTLEPSELGGELESNDYNVTFNFPAYIVLSGYHEFNDRWAVALNYSYTWWDVYKAITLKDTAIGDLPPGEQNFSNTWAISGGVYFTLNNKWSFAVGGLRDHTPTNDVDREIAFPESDVWAINVAVRYKMASNMVVDLGYAHPFYEEVDVNNVNVIIEDIVEIRANGVGRLYADALSLQLTWNVR